MRENLTYGLMRGGGKPTYHEHGARFLLYNRNSDEP